MQLPILVKNMEQSLIAEKLKRLLPNGCRKILMVNPVEVPEWEYSIEVAWDNRYPVYPPYGEGLLTRDLSSRGYEVDVIDLNYDLQEHLKKDRGNFQYNVWRIWLKNKIETFNPEVIGLTCMFTVTYRQMAETAKFIKELNPRIIIFAGGVHPTMASDLVLEDCAHIDFIGLYEGNKSFGDTIDFANGKTPDTELTQIATLINGKYTAITKRAEPTQESINLRPDYKSLPIGKYSRYGRIGTYYWLFEPGTRAATILINRGCRAQCTFCSVRNFNGPRVEKRDIDVVLDELEWLRDTYGINHVMLLDDDIFYNEKRTIALLEGWTKRNLNISWDATNGVIASAVTEEIIHAAAESGCRGLSFGIESGNAEILKSVKKPSGLKHFYKVGEILRKYPQIFTKGLLMVGFPNETVGQQKDTVRLAQDVLLDWYTIQPLNLIPGVEITNHFLVEGIIKKHELMDGTERPYVGSTGAQIKREKQEHEKALEFRNILEDDPNRIPPRPEIKDVWFVMDYLVNYQKIEREARLNKLEMLRKLFINMCDNTHKENALGNLYFAMIEAKLGNAAEAKRRLELASKFARSVAYWDIRFEVLGLNNVLSALDQQMV